MKFSVKVINQKIINILYNAIILIYYRTSYICNNKPNMLLTLTWRHDCALVYYTYQQRKRKMSKHLKMELCAKFLLVITHGKHLQI